MRILCETGRTGIEIYTRTYIRAYIVQYIKVDEMEIKKV